MGQDRLPPTGHAPQGHGSGITHTLSLTEDQCKKLSSCRALQEQVSKSLALVR